MGVINVTPDSFSGDGLLQTGIDPVVRARALLAEGVDVLDVGGESTRPGYHPVGALEEAARVLPAVAAIAASTQACITIDTMKAEVADRALAAGAAAVNDVSGLGDSDMPAVVAAHDAGLVIVHHGSVDSGVDLMTAIVRELMRLVDRAVAGGVDPAEIVIDPGLGMGKDWRDNLEIIRRLPELRQVGRPILVGPSRKGTIGRVLGVGVDDRLEGTAALVTLCIAGGADMVRVHDTLAMYRVARMTDALARPVGDQSGSPA